MRNQMKPIRNPKRAKRTPFNTTGNHSPQGNLWGLSFGEGENPTLDLKEQSFGCEVEMTGLLNGCLQNHIDNASVLDAVQRTRQEVEQAKTQERPKKGNREEGR